MKDSGFCGPHLNATKVGEGILANECFLDGLSFIPHILFILISLPILIVWNKSYYGSLQAQTWVHFPLHTCRWVLSIILILLNFTEIGEGLISDSQFSGHHLHLYIPHCVALIGSVFSIVYYHSVESWNSPRFLLLLMVYWLAALTIKILRVFNLFGKGLGVSHLRFDLTWDVIIVYGLLLLLEIYVLFSLRYTFFKNPVQLRPPEELEQTKYVHTYVNFLSKSTFFWLNKLLFSGYRRTVELSDLGQLPPSEWAVTNYKKLHQAFEDEKKKTEGSGKTPSLWKCYAKAFWPMLLLGAFFKLLGDMLSFVGPLCIARIIIYVEKVQGTPSNYTRVISEDEHFTTLSEFLDNGYVMAVIMFIAMVLQNSCLQTHFFIVIREAVRVRGAIQAMVYEKALRLSSFTMTSGAMSAGQISNHLSVDAFNLMMCFFFYNYVWALPLKCMVCRKTLSLSTWALTSGWTNEGLLYSHMFTDSFNLMLFFMLVHFGWSIMLQIAITLGLLYRQLGYTALLGGALIVLLSPVQYLLASAFSRVQKKVLECSDERLRRCNELLQGIKLLKLYAWEKIFCGQVEAVRNKQLKLVFKGCCLSALTVFMTEGTPILVVLVTFTLYPYMYKEPLTASNAFSTMALFDLLTIPLFVLPLVITTYVNARVSTGRLLPYFLAPEVDRCGGVPLIDLANVKLTDPKVEFHSGVLPSVSIVGGNQRSRNLSGSLDHPKRKRTVSGTSVESASSDRHSKTGSLVVDGSQDSRSKSPKMWRPGSASSMSSADAGTHDYGLGKPDSQPLLTPQRHHSSGGLSGAESLDDVIDEMRDVGVAVEFKDANFAWDVELRKADLESINLQIDAGKLTMVVGGVGVGKSSLLAAMLGEMCRLSGTVTWKSGATVAYAAQKPWLLNASLQDNILFGSPMEKKRYRRVISACALQPDINILPAGDQTEIGEKGINLSGGQKQRISVARAMYSKADIVLLDDPLSALDVHVGAHMFEDGILKFLLKRKRTVVLVTHQLQYMGHAHKIVRIDNGMITHQGMLNEIKESDPELFNGWQKAIKQSRKDSEQQNQEEESTTKMERRILQRQISTREFQRQISMPHRPISRVHVPQRQISHVPQRQISHGHGDESEETPAQSPNRKSIRTYAMAVRWSAIKSAQADSAPGTPDEQELCRPRPFYFGRQVSNMSVLDDLEVDDPSAIKRALSSPEPVTAEPDEKDEVEAGDEKGKLITAEDRSKGSVAMSVYLSYMRAISIPLALLAIVLLVAKHAFSIAKDFWLAMWSQAPKSMAGANSNSTSASQDIDVHYYIRGYALLGCAAVLMALFVAFGFQMAGLKAAMRLHHCMLKNIILVPMRFFDTTPIGRIINRLSGDTYIIDDKLPSNLLQLLHVSLLCSASLLVNAINVPYFLIPVVPIVIIYYFLQRFFRASSIELQRLDSITKSPIFAHFSETLNGLVTIRAFRDQVRFWRTTLKKIDTNITAFLYLNTSNRWLGVRLDHLGALVMFVASIAAVTAGVMGQIGPGMVGLCITYTLAMSGYLNWVVRNLTDAEMRMNSVERVLEYTHLPTEPYHTAEDVSVSPDWPHAGEIHFQDVSLRYDASLEAVIKNINLTIKAGQKVGICGRTGSGKSSLTLGLFRIIDLFEGQILIDGIDISKVPLDSLRSRLAIIPQDPVLFAGTVRYNLDPLREKTDAELWDALEIAQLKNTITQQPQQLESEVSEMGENYSVGQRQLFCLARAFLKKTTILVMDEATASVDMETDAIIQEVIATAFRDRTVLTIAHRVATIVNCDMIVVLDHGCIVEHDMPQSLLAKPDSIFTSLVTSGK